MNPIISRLNGGTPQTPQNNILGLLAMLKSGNPDALFNQLMNANPQFRSFVEKNRGRDMQSIANEYGIDLNSVMNLLK